MNEASASVTLPMSNMNPQSIGTRIYNVANVLLVPSSSPDTLFLFAARTIATDADVLVEVKVNEGRANVKVNCDKMVIGQMLLKEIRSALTKV